MARIYGAPSTGSGDWHGITGQLLDIRPPADATNVLIIAVMYQSDPATIAVPGEPRWYNSAAVLQFPTTTLVHSTQVQVTGGRYLRMTVYSAVIPGTMDGGHVYRNSGDTPVTTETSDVVAFYAPVTLEAPSIIESAVGTIVDGVGTQTLSMGAWAWHDRDSDPGIGIYDDRYDTHDASYYFTYDYGLGGPNGAYVDPFPTEGETSLTVNKHPLEATRYSFIGFGVNVQVAPTIETTGGSTDLRLLRLTHEDLPQVIRSRMLG